MICDVPVFVSLVAVIVADPALIPVTTPLEDTAAAAVLPSPAIMSSFEVSPFEEWPCQQVQVEHGTIFLRYAGTGPPIMLLHGVPQYSVCSMAL